MDTPQTQTQAIDLLAQARDELHSTQIMKRAIASLWVAWKIAFKLGKETRSFLDCITENGAFFEGIANTLTDCTQFHMPKQNDIDAIVGGASISTVFAYLARTDHQSSEINRNINRQIKAGRSFRSLCGISVHDEKAVAA